MLPGIGAVLLWSLSVAFTRGISETIGRYNAAAIIYLCSGILLTVIKYRRVSIYKVIFSGPVNWRLLVCAVFFSGSYLSYYTAVGSASTRAQVLEAGLINYLWPTLTALAAIPIMRIKPRIVLFAGITTALAGVVLVLRPQDSSMLHTSSGTEFSVLFTRLCALSAAVCWALYSALTGRWRTRNVNNVPFFMLITGIAAVFFAVLKPHTPVFTPVSVTELIILLCSSSAATMLWGTAMQGNGMYRAVLLSNFIPLISTVFSAYYLRTPLQKSILFGCILICAGTFLSNKQKKQSSTAYK